MKFTQQVSHMLPGGCCDRSTNLPHGKRQQVGYFILKERKMSANTAKGFNSESISRILSCVRNLGLALDEDSSLPGYDRAETERYFRQAHEDYCALPEGSLELRALSNLYSAARLDIAWARNLSRLELTGTQPRFERNLETLLPGATMAKRPKPKAPTRLRPDFWVELDGTVMPVEVKKGKFNGKALDQLLGYMQEFGCDQGVAVGATLAVTLPQNVRFVCVK